MPDMTRRIAGQLGVFAILRICRSLLVSPEYDFDVAGYIVERSSDKTNWIELGDTEEEYFTDRIAYVDQSKTYYYRVRAYDFDGNYSNYSDVICAPGIPYA